MVDARSGNTSPLPYYIMTIPPGTKGGLGTGYHAAFRGNVGPAKACPAGEGDEENVPRCSC